MDRIKVQLYTKWMCHFLIMRRQQARLGSKWVVLFAWSL